MRSLCLHCLPALLVLAYAVFASTLAIRQHDSFHTHAFDMAYFDNVLWNTSQGRIFVNDFPDKPRIFLGEHFSPALIVLAPLYWLWSDARVLLIAQAVALALSVVPCYLSVRRHHPALAPFVMAALYFNPALLGVALSEFHEIALAAPFLAYAIYALESERNVIRKRLLAIGLLGALLVKEEVAVIVAAVGIYLLVSRFILRQAPVRYIPQGRQDRLFHASRLTPHARRIKYQLPITHYHILGITFIVIATVWLAFVWGALPTVLPDAVSHWQVRYGDIAPTPWQGAQRLLADPAFLIARYASAPRWEAVARVLWPLAFLPLLSPALCALALPVLAYLLLSSKASVSTLQFWYVTPLLPILFVASATAIARASLKQARVLTLALCAASVIAYVLLDAGPFASQYEPARFAVNERTVCGQQLLTLIPPDASISAQDNLMPHLAHRRALNVFPALGEPLAEYVALDARYAVVGGYSNWPLFRRAEVPAVLNRFLSQPEYELVGDGCDYKILRDTRAPLITRPTDQPFAQPIRLRGYEIAAADEQGIYQVAPRSLAARQGVRVMLWWQATARLDKDYTVFVHALDATGRVVGQHDSPPANGFRPTTQWSEGEIVKDIHYFALEATVEQIEVGLYDAQTGQRLTLANGGDAIRILGSQ